MYPCYHRVQVHLYQPVTSTPPEYFMFVSLSKFIFTSLRLFFLSFAVYRISFHFPNYENESGSEIYTMSSAKNISQSFNVIAQWWFGNIKFGKFETVTKVFGIQLSQCHFNGREKETFWRECAEIEFSIIKLIKHVIE